MKSNTHLPLLFALLFTLFFAACKEDTDMTVSSLNKMGESFVPGDKVQLWASIEPVTYAILDFSWTNTGGTFLGVPGLFENVWIAPNDFAATDSINSVREYTVTVTATLGKNKSSRSTIMRVLKQ